MIRKLQDGLLQVRGWFVSSYILIEDSDAYIIDGGFVGDFKQLEKALSSAGLSWDNVRAILLTHGHLDHSYNVGKIVEKSNATVYGHRDDSLHFEGKYPYQGISKICGCLEWLGRTLFGFKPVRIDRTISDGEELDFWGGIEVIHLPGHTNGHCGYYSTKRGILFSGDLFVNSDSRVMLPWPWLNSCPEDFTKSIGRVINLSPLGILANHCDRANAVTQMLRFASKFK